MAKALEGKWAVSGAQLEEKAGTPTPEPLKPDSILRVMESHRGLYVGPLCDHICFSGEKISLSCTQRTDDGRRQNKSGPFSIIQGEKWRPPKGP